MFSSWVAVLHIYTTLCIILGYSWKANKKGFFNMFWIMFTGNKDSYLSDAKVHETVVTKTPHVYYWSVYVSSSSSAWLFQIAHRHGERERGASRGRGRGRGEGQGTKIVANYILTVPSTLYSNPSLLSYVQYTLYSTLHITRSSCSSNLELHKILAETFDLQTKWQARQTKPQICVPPLSSVY